MVFSLLACAAAIVMLVRYSRIKQASLKAYEERKALLRKYGVSSSKDIGGVLAAHKALWDAVRQAEENGEVFAVTDDVPRTAIVTEEFGLRRIYLTAVSSGAIQRRCEK